MIDLSHDQKSVLENLLIWFSDKHKPQFITLGGYAGTGKTTLISILRKKIHLINKKRKKFKVAFISFTGKAARVLDIKLRESKAVYPQDYVGTIHSLIYSPIVNSKEEIVGWERRDKVMYDLIIVDEASMVNEIIWNDLCSYKIPIVVVGDHGQLPPIKGSFNLMESPVLKLEEIHRQARDNPIIKLSIIARKYGFIPAGDYADKVKKISRSDAESQEAVEDLLHSYNKDTFILCGYNKTRVKLNNFVRNALDFESPIPTSGDRVICLRNNHIKKIYNGMLGTVQSIEKQDNDWYFAEIMLDNEKKIYKGLISSQQFGNLTPINFTQERRKIMKGDLFDFGYAMTVHKAQGSQAKRIILFEERFRQMDDIQWQRWLYTAVTRAIEELFIIGS